MLINFFHSFDFGRLIGVSLFEFIHSALPPNRNVRLLDDDNDGKAVQRIMRYQHTSRHSSYSPVMVTGQYYSAELRG